jgi:chromosome segregation ATPase
MASPRGFSCKVTDIFEVSHEHERSKMRQENEGLNAEVDALTSANGEMEKRLRLNATNNMKFAGEEDLINLIRQTETPNSFTKEDGEKIDEPLDSQKQQVRQSMYELDALKKMCDQLRKQLAQLEVTRGESTVEPVQIEELVGEMERKIGMVQNGIQATWKETRHAQRQVRTELRVCASRSAELERERDILAGKLEREQRNKETERRDKEEATNQHWVLKRERDHSSRVIETSRSNSQILEFIHVKHEQVRKKMSTLNTARGSYLTKV